MGKPRENVEKIYMGLIIAAGFFLLVYLSVAAPIRTNLFSVVFLCVLGIIAETQTVSISKENSVSITIAIIICTMLTCGETAAAWVAALSVLGTFTKVRGEGYRHIFNIRPEATLFNMSSYALGLFLAATTYRLLGGEVLAGGSSFGRVMGQINRFALPLVVSIFVFVMANTIIVALYISIKQGESLLRIWVSYLLWSVLSLFFVGLLGVIITAIYVSYGYFLVVVFFAPFVLARYVFSIYKDLQENYLETVMSLAAAIETKDIYTIGHSRRVEYYCSITANEMKLRPKRCEVLKYAALLHDIGKIGIKDEILNKPSRLSREEIDVIRLHPDKGAHIIEDIEFLSKSVEIIRSHHERYDGSGYPRGLTGKDLPVESMILMVSDSYDAMTSDRPYRKALSHEQAILELHLGTGTQFCPEVVVAFESAMKKRGNKPYVI
ncbi:MAG: HD-GYP domain-containing protein [Clostridia bacterium]|nr:HD-GYP domain-containing protein [Clostridia bacterium]MDR3644006.1 HD-GYP domain-containing protein [Clostridia bacterium]